MPFKLQAQLLPLSMQHEFLFVIYRWAIAWMLQHNFPLLAQSLQYTFAKENKIFAVFCTAKLKGERLRTAVAYFIERYSFLLIFFHKGKIRKKLFSLGISFICPLECICLCGLIFLGCLPECFFIPATESFYYWF